MKNYIDPYKLKTFPVVAMSCDLTGFIPWAIRFITNDHWNHVMESRQVGAWVSQNLMYKEIPFKYYMNRFHRLKYGRLKI